MPVKFDDLTEQQKADFWARVKKWGLTPEDVQPSIHTGKIGPKACISGDALASDVKTKPFMINSVQHLKQMVGIPDEHFTSGKMRDRHVNYPQALPSHRHQLLVEAPDNCWLKSRLTDEEHETVQASAYAYLVGNSSKIAAPMVDMINAVHFPKLCARVAVGDITVATGTTYTFGKTGDPNVLAIVAGVITVEPGGTIAFASACDLEVQHTEVVAAPTVRAVALGAPTDESPAGAITVYSPAPAPPNPPPQQPPRGKANGANAGVAHLDKHSNPDGCTTQGSAGIDGDPGYTGSTGTNGQAGVSPPAFIWHTDKLQGTLTVNCGGGNAQDGGQGGQGGNGGTGGDGAAGAGGKCNNQPPGKGGIGGTGGPGGVPGDAANGSTSNLYYKQAIQPWTVSLVTLGGYGGKPGLGGLPGAGGSGGADPGNTQPAPYVPANYTHGGGQNGPTGNGGNNGKNATFSGNVIVTQVPS